MKKYLGEKNEDKSRQPRGLKNTPLKVKMTLTWSEFLSKPENGNAIFASAGFGLVSLAYGLSIKSKGKGFGEW
jgi:hypothetical protein